MSMCVDFNAFAALSSVGYELKAMVSMNIYGHTRTYGLNGLSDTTANVQATAKC